MAFLFKVFCFLPLFFTYGFPQPIFFGYHDPFKNPFIGRLKSLFGGEGGDNGNGGEENIKNHYYNTAYKGGWELASENSGVSAMHMVLFPNNKIIMFDATDFGPSQIQLPDGDCRQIPKNNIRRKKNNQVEDCWAHSVQYDIDTADIKPLKILTDTWCSSGGLAADGTLVSTGGWNDGAKSVRYLTGCSTCDWKEYPKALSGARWYSTQQILPDGGFILIGGRRMFNYEYVPKEGISNTKNFDLPFLRETTDNVENNLYPFVHLSTDGNLFVFANNRSILLDPNTNKIVREYPILSGGSRNYPASGMSALLPIKLHSPNPKVIQVEVLVCGGAKPESAKQAEKGIYLSALQDCGRIDITDPNATWKKETMPSPRVMGDMLILPTGDILMINGAKKGVSGWQFADDPNYVPVFYKPDNPTTERFSELRATTITRMYHSTSAVLPDGKILVAGSNTNNWYNFTGVKYPTELRVEKFYPPYLDPLLSIHRPSILSDFNGKVVKYGSSIEILFSLKKLLVEESNLKVTTYAPPFTTHGYSMNQRLVVLAISQLTNVMPGIFQVNVMAPPTGAIAPPGYYLLFVVHRGVPSPGIWVQLS